MSQTPDIHPTGGGHNFSFNRAIRPDQLSPRSSSESDSDSEPRSDTSIGLSQPQSPTSDQPDDTHTLSLNRVVAEANFTLEELNSDSDNDDIPVLRPHGVEDPESERSRSREATPLRHAHMVQQFGGLNCGDDESSDEYDIEDYRDIIERIRQEKRQRRMTSGSIGKRTISESIGSDSDHEDVMQPLELPEHGSFTRRTRRKVTGRRMSLLHLMDPHPERIDEVEELQSNDDENVDIFAKELPYYSMEVDSP